MVKEISDLTSQVKNPESKLIISNIFKNLGDPNTVKELIEDLTTAIIQTKGDYESEALLGSLRSLALTAEEHLVNKPGYIPI